MSLAVNSTFCQLVLHQYGCFLKWQCDRTLGDGQGLGRCAGGQRGPHGPLARAIPYDSEPLVIGLACNVLWFTLSLDSRAMFCGSPTEREILVSPQTSLPLSGSLLITFLLSGGLCGELCERLRHISSPTLKVKKRTKLLSNIGNSTRVCHEVPISTERAQIYIRS